MKKKCSKCNKEKYLFEFNKHSGNKDGHTYFCKECRKIQSKIYREQNSEYIIKWRNENSERHKKLYKKWRKKNLEYSREYNKNWRKEHREDNNKLLRQYRQDLQVKLGVNMGNAIRQALNGNKNGRHWEDLVGYTLKQLKQRLELNFQEGMSWENKMKWHIDHKKPQSLFNYKYPEEQSFKDCWSLANLQPLWAQDNRIKYNKFN